MLQFFKDFLGRMKGSFRSIAKATKHEITEEDLQQEAWLIALEIGTKRGQEIDFSDSADQSLIIRAVNHRNVKRGDWHLRRSVRIDQDVEGNEGTMQWLDRLPAPASADPIVSILRREAEVNAVNLLASSYSQAAAYVFIFVHFKNSLQEAAAYLVVSKKQLSRRVDAAAHTVKFQPSLFDRIDRISATYMPPPGKQYFAKVEQHLKADQWGWEF